MYEGHELARHRDMMFEVREGGRRFCVQSEPGTAREVVHYEAALATCFHDDVLDSGHTTVSQDPRTR